MQSCDKYNYLRIIISKKRTYITKIKYRVKKGRIAVTRLRGVNQKKNQQRNTRYITIIKSVVTSSAKVYRISTIFWNMKVKNSYYFVFIWP